MQSGTVILTDYLAVSYKTKHGLPVWPSNHIPLYISKWVKNYVHTKTCVWMDISALSVQFSSIAQSCPTLFDPMGCSLSGSSIHGIFQVRVLEWISFSRGPSRPRNRTQVSCIAGRCFTVWATREAPEKPQNPYKLPIVDGERTLFPS